MKKTTLFLFTLALLAASGAANAAKVELIAHNQRSSSGTLSTLKWSGCTTYGTTTACINPANVNLANMGITPSTAVWDWNAATGVLSMTGSFNTASTIGSSGASAASAVIGDKVTNMVIDTTNDTTTAASYNCAEGNFLAGVGAHGCANLGLGDDFTYNSSMLYNVGGAADCVQRTISGDDVSTGNPRGVTNRAAGGGCDATDGAFTLWTVVQDNLGTGGTLIISNGVDLAAAGTNYLTFQAVPEAVDDGPFDALEEVALDIDVLANDTGFADPVTVEVTTPPAKGGAVVTGTSPGPQAGIRIQYTAAAGQSGADSFVYTVTDADGITTDTATVTLNVLPFGANDDVGATTRNKGPVNINVGANDVGFADDVTITIISAPDQGGSATPPAAGPAATRVVSYTPATTAPGTPTYQETFVYQITDADLVTDTATVTVTVSNTVPVAGDTTVNISTAGSAPGSTPGSFNAGTLAGNSLGDPPSVVTKTDPTKGTVSVSGNVVTYTPSVTFFSGTDQFTYTITDSDPVTPESDTGAVTVNIPDISPVIGDASISTPQDTASAPRALTITPGNGSVAQHTLAVTTPAANGTCALSGTSVTYTPNAGYTGSDSCVVTLTDEDGNGQSDTATISITVTSASSGGGGGVSGGLLPNGGGGALGPWGLALLAGAAWARRRRAAGGTRR